MQNCFKVKINLKKDFQLIFRYFLCILFFIALDRDILWSQTTQNEKTEDFFKTEFPNLDINHKLVINAISDLIYTNSAEFVGAFLIDSSDFTPSFFKRFYHPVWRKLTEHTLDNQSQYAFDKRVTLSTNALLDASTIWNYQVKIHLIQEATFIPQITVGVSHFFRIPLRKSRENENIGPMHLHGVGVFGTISKSFSSTTKFFFGGRYTYENYKISFSEKFEKKIENIAPNKEQSILKLRNLKRHAGDFFTGINILSKDSDWETAITLGTDFDKLFYWIWANSFSYITIGVNFQAMSVITLRPFILLKATF